MPKPKKPKRLPLPPVPPEQAENKAPDDETEWLNNQKSGDPSDHVGLPSGLKGMSQMDALAWIRANCKFAQRKIN